MTKEKGKWDDIPSLEGLEVDWQFEPDNPLGKRGLVRISRTELYPLLEVKSIPIKVVAKNFDEKGYVVDLAKNGLAVLLNSPLAESQPVKIGFFLGQQKIVSRAVIRNVRAEQGGHRIGIEFVDLDEDSASFIVGLISSKGYKPIA
jgi:hypothetical protein